MKKIVILYGGKSGEHEVSLLSAGSIARHIDRRLFDPILVGVAKDGSWRLQPESMRIPESGPLPLAPGPRVLAAPAAGLVVERDGRLEALACDVVFPVLHGTFGEDGTIQGLLEVAGLPYVGAGVLGSALGMDKEKAKELWVKAGLPVLPWVSVRRGHPALAETASGRASEGESALVAEVSSRLGWPAFVKPACAGSSVGASRADGPAALVPALRAALEWDEKALVEPCVNARELECSVLGNDKPLAYAPCEIIPSHEFYDYEAKYVDPDGARFEVPARLEAAQLERVGKLALAAYAACELAGMARVDFFLDRVSGEVYLNEANTIPGFTSISMYPRMCEVGGLSYPALITRLIELALERHDLRSSIRFVR